MTRVDWKTGRAATALLASACLLGTAPASAQPTAGLYAVASSSQAIFVVESATITPMSGGRRTASEYILDQDGRFDGHYTDIYDCSTHHWHRLSGHLYAVTKDKSDVTVDQEDQGTGDDQIDDVGSSGRDVEDFVCHLPTSAKVGTLLPGLPANERALMLELALRAMNAFALPRDEPPSQQQAPPSRGKY
jgi:hypothetical protein